MYKTRKACLSARSFDNLLSVDVDDDRGARVRLVVVRRVQIEELVDRRGFDAIDFRVRSVVHAQNDVGVTKFGGEVAAFDEDLDQLVYVHGSTITRISRDVHSSLKV